jgi:hypothetical protein
MLGWQVDERGIEPHVRVFDKSERTDGTLSCSDFAFDPEGNRYVCPGGKALRKYHRLFSKPRDGVTIEATMIYFARKDDCEACALGCRSLSQSFSGLPTRGDHGTAGSSHPSFNRDVQTFEASLPSDYPMFGVQCLDRIGNRYDHDGANRSSLKEMFLRRMVRPSGDRGTGSAPRGQADLFDELRARVSSWPPLEKL